MATPISDTEMVLPGDEEIVATARYTARAVSDGNGPRSSPPTWGVDGRHRKI